MRVSIVTFLIEKMYDSSSSLYLPVKYVKLFFDQSLFYRVKKQLRFCYFIMSAF